MNDTTKGFGRRIEIGYPGIGFPVRLGDWDSIVGPIISPITTTYPSGL